MSVDRIESQGLAQHLVAMAATVDALAATQDLNSILRVLATRAREITGADYSAISTFDEHGKLERFIFVGMPEELARAVGAPPTGRGLLGSLVGLSAPLRLEDLRQHPDFTGWPAAHPEMAAFLGIPMRSGGRTIGSFYMTKNEGEPAFTSEDELAASFLALQATLTVASALTRSRDGRLALLEERERIAHDLHDGTIQALFALGISLDRARGMALLPEVQEILEDGIARAQDIIGDIRRYISVLEARSLPGSPELSRDLPHAVRQIVPDSIATVVNITASALQELSDRTAEDLVHIAREALSNAVRHSGATKVAVDLRQTPEETVLTIQDNGSGYNPETARAGLGTVSMNSRAERIGGTLTIVSIPAMGTTIRVSLPRAGHD